VHEWLIDLELFAVLVDRGEAPVFGFDNRL
jgi:hypothetical protein